MSLEAVMQMFRNLFLLVTISVALLSACILDSTEKSARSQYSDQEVMAFIDQYPGLSDSFDGDSVPEDVLERLEIDVAALQVIDTYIGDCPTQTVYRLSSRYDLVVDDNDCFGYHVVIVER
jgi:hypothetical protein